MRYKTGGQIRPLLTFTEILKMTNEKTPIFQPDFNPEIFIENDQPVTEAYKTSALQHGIGNSAVSSQWYNRPED